MTALDAEGAGEGESTGLLLPYAALSTSEPEAVGAQLMDQNKFTSPSGQHFSLQIMTGT